jgi:hypothetical protein
MQILQTATYNTDCFWIIETEMLLPIIDVFDRIKSRAEVLVVRGAYRACFDLFGMPALCSISKYSLK